MAKKNPLISAQRLKASSGTTEPMKMSKNQAIKSVLAYKLEAAMKAHEPLQGTDGRAHGNQSLSARPVARPVPRTKA